MRSKTVYFLGAGASKALFGLPTMENFFDKFSVEDYPALSDFLRNYFFSTDRIGQLGAINASAGGFEEIVRDSNLNLEEVITALDLSLDRFGSFGNLPKGYIIDAKKEFNDYILKRLLINITDENMKSRFEKICNKTSIIFERISKIRS